MVMTEEILDDWEAQTLKIPYEKLIRHKKAIYNVGSFKFLFIDNKGGAIGESAFTIKIEDSQHDQ